MTRTDFQFMCTPPIARLRVAGELDLATRDRLRDVLECLQVRGCTQVEVDLAAVSFIDACALGVLHDEQCRVVAAGGSLEVVAASRCHQRVAELAGYDGLLAVDPPCGDGRRPRLRLLHEQLSASPPQARRAAGHG